MSFQEQLQEYSNSGSYEKILDYQLESFNSFQLLFYFIDAKIALKKVNHAEILLEQNKNLENQLDKALWHLLYGKLHIRNERLDLAIENLKNGFELVDSDPTTIIGLQIKIEEAMVYYIKNLFPKCLTELTSINMENFNFKDSFNYSRVYYLQGLVNWVLQKNDKAEKFLDIALNVDTKFENKTNIAKCYNIKSLIFYNQGELQKALDMLSQAKILLHQVSDELTFFKSIEILAEIKSTQGFLNQALELYYQVFEFYEKREGKNDYEILNLNQNIGFIHFQLGNFLEAEKYFLIAFEKAKGINNPLFLAIAIKNLIEIFLESGNISKSNSYLELFPEYENNPIISAFDREIQIIIHQSKGDYEKAKEIGISFIDDVQIPFNLKQPVIEKLIIIYLNFWSKNKDSDLLDKIKQLLDEWENQATRIHLYASLGKLYLFKVKFYSSILDIETAEKAINKCLEIAEQFNLPLHLSLAQEEKSKLDILKESLKPSIDNVSPEIPTLDNFINYFKDIKEIMIKKELELKKSEEVKD
ncbi:MAG: tetratricopeptide repeat protein [Candidatus Hodarchaeales archaeon]|jgi:tetratricopeptide (TPR) repeat protein